MISLLLRLQILLKILKQWTRGKIQKLEYFDNANRISSETKIIFRDFFRTIF